MDISSRWTFMSIAGSSDTTTKQSWRRQMFRNLIGVDGYGPAGRFLMNDSYRAFFCLTKEPFSTELTIKEILETPDLKGVKDRFDYAVRLGAVALVTGEVGSGKSTALRYAASHLHPSASSVFHITPTSTSIIELYP